MKISLPRRVVAEFLGTAFLVAAVIGSGIMGERLANGNLALALLAKTVATGAALVALITALGSVSNLDASVNAIIGTRTHPFLSWTPTERSNTALIVVLSELALVFPLASS